MAGFLTLLLFLIAPSLFGDEPRVLKVVETFEADKPRAGLDLRPISFWRWSEADKANAGSFSQLERVALPGASEGHGLRVSIPKTLPPGLDFFALWSTGLDYLPPETTAIRMRAKVVSGRFTLSVGSPTTYFATSDVRARPRVLEPDPGADRWQTVTFSLVENLERNYRRPVFSTDSPVIYYTRWIQEPMRLLIGADSTGELWLDDIELLASGEGGAFPAFADNEVRPLAKADLGAAFTFATDDREFDLSHTAGKEALRKPALLRKSSDGHGGLEATQLGLEEMSFIGVPTLCPDGTNALRITLTMTHGSAFEELAVDVLTLVAPEGEFPWEKTVAAKPETRGFDRCLSPRRTEGLSWGFYHARRALKSGERTSLVIPFPDFVCAYGSGGLRDRHLLQQPLVASEVTAVALVSPYRQRQGETRFTIDSIEAVAIPPLKEGGISYPQVPDLSRIRLETMPGPQGKQARQVEVK